MSEEFIQFRFAALEQRVEAVVEALRDGDTTQIEILSSQLQEMTLEFAREVGNFPAQADVSSAQLRRVKALSQGFRELRENLLRRQALVEQALQVVIPATHSQTYASPKASPYGAGPKASGRFQVYSA